MKKFLMSFKYAIDGIIYVIKSEFNMRIHLLAVLIVTICSFVFHISKTSLIVCIILFGLVLSAECFNTAVLILFPDTGSTLGNRLFKESLDSLLVLG